MLLQSLFFAIVVLNSLVEANNCVVQYENDVILDGSCTTTNIVLYRDYHNDDAHFCFSMSSSSIKEVQTKMTMKFGKQTYDAQYIGLPTEELIILNQFKIVYFNISGCIRRRSVFFDREHFNDTIEINSKGEGYTLAIEFTLDKPLPALRIKFYDTLLYNPKKITFEEYNRIYLFRASLADLSMLLLVFIVIIFCVYLQLRMIMLCASHCD
ncbi:hypothetical protein M3Y95_00783800 [Aphelenchoides besseyi]|nr:hypothetical protein M3Y95_00783800 [Aphelenchoides besseyi]